MSRLQLLIDELTATRGYTENMLAAIPAEDWFRQPVEGVTHIAWQVGHLAIAEFHLALQRVRDRRPEDAELIPESFSTLFGKGSVPEADAAKYPSVPEIRAVFDRVHQQSLRELAELSDEVLDDPTGPPHPMFSTKFGALQWCSLHEMLHVGQIALLRRLFGGEPLR